MPLYYSTFISGLLTPVKEALQKALPNCQFRLELDGLIVYETNAKVSHLESLPFLTNTFQVIKMLPPNVNRSVGELAQQVIKDRTIDLRLPSNAGGRHRTFRVITSLANQLVPINPKIMRALEELVEFRTGARPYRAKPDIEIWLLQRSEGYGFFSVRVSRHKSYDKTLEKGELRPDLAYILCFLSRPTAKELFLDPFCGSGAIPLQRTRFPLGLIIASDSDCQKIDRLKERVQERGLKKRMVVRCEDAMKLDRYSDGSIHAIVTDPPWGHFESLKMPIEKFYRDMLDELIRLLVTGGRLVVLTAQTEVFRSIIEEKKEKISLAETLSILVSGKKACVYVLVRK